MSTKRQKPSKRELKEFIEVYEDARKETGKGAVSLSDAIEASHAKNEGAGQAYFENFKKLVDIVVKREKSKYISEKSEITVKEFFSIYKKAYDKVYDAFDYWEYDSSFYNNTPSYRTMKTYLDNKNLKKSSVFGGLFNMNFKKFSKQREHFNDFAPFYVLLGMPAFIIGVAFLPSLFALPFLASIFYVSYIYIANRISKSRRKENTDFMNNIGKMMKNDPAFGNTLISVGKKKDMDERIVENLLEEFEKMKSQK